MGDNDGPRHDVMLRLAQKQKGLDVALSRPLQSKEDGMLIQKGQLLATTHVIMPCHAQKGSPDQNPNTYPTLFGRIGIASGPDS